MNFKNILNQITAITIIGGLCFSTSGVLAIMTENMDSRTVIASTVILMILSIKLGSYRFLMDLLQTEDQLIDPM